MFMLNCEYYFLFKYFLVFNPLRSEKPDFGTSGKPHKYEHYRNLN
jgi:hypothetical protein